MRRRFRLRRSADFELLWRHGKRWHHPLAVLIVRKSERQTNRYGFIASKRVGKATERNRVKRMLREVVRQRMTDIEDGWDLLLIARRSTTEATYSELEDAVEQLFRSARLVRTNSRT